MTARCDRWAMQAILIAAAFALSACAGGGLSTTPSTQGSSQAPSGGADNGARLDIAAPYAYPNVKCPKKYLTCYTASKKTGLAIAWCYGAASNPCVRSHADKASWSGIVCTAKGQTCKKPIKQLTAKWSGPFKCRKKDQCRGTYELDTLAPGPGLKRTITYVYKQDIHACVGKNCQDVYIGLNVGK